MDWKVPVSSIADVTNSPLPFVQNFVQSLAHCVIFAPCQKVIAARLSPFSTNGGFCALG